MNALLQQIANPNVPDFNAAFRKGQEGARQDRSRNALAQVLGGNRNAMPELLQNDPQAGFEVQKYLSQLDENSRKRLAENTELAARELIGVSQIQDPQQKLSAWQQALQRHKGMGLDTSSYEGLDPDAGMNIAASRILPVADLLRRDKPANLPTEEIGVGGGMFQKVQVMPDGTTRPLGTPYRKAADASVDLRRSMADDKASKEQAKADAAKGETVAKYEYTLNLIDDLRRHPGLSTAVGAKGVTGGLLFGQTVPGTDAADFVARLDQLGGRQFLQAFESLKGGGQITQIEGEKATNAIARLQRSQSEGEFKKALDEFYGVIELGLKRLRGEAPMPNEQGGAQAPAASGGQIAEGATATNPQTGERVVYRGGRWVPAQ